MEPSTPLLGELDQAGLYWSTKKADAANSRWWTNALILEHINKIVCGAPLSGFSSGVSALMARSIGAPLEHGVSVGCGDGTKELNLLASGHVQRFTLYELAEERILAGRRKAEGRGLSHRVEFIKGNASELAPGGFDLVYWNNALHHMMDTDAAVRWSREILRAGGWFVMDDFVGPTRFQWSDFNLEMANRVREALPDRFFDGSLPRRVGRPDPEKLRLQDPSEAADSDNILPAIGRHFSDAFIRRTGGCIYHTGLNGILANFTAGDEPLLRSLLLLDESMARFGATQYAVALAMR